MRFTRSGLLLAAAAVATGSSCSKSTANALKTRCETPWLAGRIAEAQRNDRGLDSVVEYRFKGSSVYVFNLGFVYDGDAPVYGCDGSLLCRLGGFAGNMTCDGVRFSEAATDPRTVWRKP